MARRKNLQTKNQIEATKALRIQMQEKEDQRRLRQQNISMEANRGAAQRSQLQDFEIIDQ